MFGSGIHSIEVTLLLLTAMVAVLTLLAQKLSIPYPIFLLLGGLAVSFIPGTPKVSLDPSFIFLVVLPPLLFAGTMNVGWREFRTNSAHILLLGLGLVAFTVIGIAACLHFIIRGFDWRTGAVLGAVVSTTDTIAIGAIARRVGLPHRILQVIEGESLVNDAMGLLALQFTTALVVSGEIPSVGRGVGEFVWLTVGGILAGLIVAIPVSRFERYVRQAALQLLVTIVTPYFAYLLGESFHASGVLSTVVCGIYFGRLRSQTLTSEARIEARAVWNTIDFSLNGLVFILIGLQLPSILHGMSYEGWAKKLEHAALVCALVMGLRFIWVFAGARIAWFLRTRVFRHQGGFISPRILTVVSWSGMRGVLTLAAALSLPAVTDTGAPFPHRQAIIFLAYCVILVTLLGQGLSLPAVIRKLNVCESNEVREEERKARAAVVRAALERLHELRSKTADVDQMSYELMERYYRDRLQTLEPTDEQKAAMKSQGDSRRTYREISNQLRVAEREELMRLHARGEIHERTLREVERDLDLLDLRWNNT